MKWAVLNSIFLCISLAYDSSAQDREEDSFIFLPGAYFKADAASAFGSEAGFTSLSQKLIEIHIVRYGPFDASFLVNERLLTSERYTEKIHPFRIEYLMEYFKLSRRFSSFSIGFFFDHICYNIIDDPEDTDAYQLRWYGVGLQVFSNGMGPGRKCRFGVNNDPAFRWLLIPQFLFSAVIPLHAEQFRYDCKAKGMLRLDVLYFLGMVPYVEAEFEALVDNELRMNRTIEAGVYAVLSNVTFSVFAGYQYHHDALIYRGGSDDEYILGVRAEACIGYTDFSVPMPGDENSAFPSIRFSGGYGKRIGSEYMGYLTHIGADLDAVKFNNLVLVLATDTSHYSKAQGNALFPRYISLSWGGGIEYFLSGRIFTGMNYERTVRCDGNAYRGHNERYHLLGFSFTSRGMRRGEVDYADAGRNDGFATHLEYRFFAGWFPQTEGFEYRMKYSATLRWDAFRYGLLVWYGLADGAYYYGDEKNYSWGVESGIRIRFNLAFEGYCRYERVTDFDRFAGTSERSAIVGFRVQR